MIFCASTDFVRLREGLDPPHWTRKPGKTWDAGYEKTGYFLDWIEKRYGTGTIKELNASMKDTTYREVVFKDLTGRPVEKLWKLYSGVTDLDNDEGSDSSATCTQ
jgi:Peptidase of plants and bacteria